MKKKGLLGILLAFVNVMTSAISANAATAEVSATALNVRSGKGTTYSVVRVLHKGDTVEVLESSGEWYKVSYNGVIGYASSKYLVKTDNSGNNTTITIAKTGIVTVSSLNVRSGPGTYYSKIGSLKKGANVQIVSTSAGWYKIKYSSGYGYISSQYVSTSSGSTKPEPIKNTTLKQNEGLVLVTMNVRSGPATAYSRIGSVSKNTKVSVISQQKGWYKIKYGNKYGYVSATYLKRSWDNSKYIISVNTNTNVLNLYDSNAQLIKSYRCATGKASTPTPRGVTTVYNKIVNRPYYKEGIPGGDPRNPLGNRWIGININNTKGKVYAIHGNNNEYSIGKHVSGGCIRMHNSEVRELYNRVPIGTKVVIQQ